jgi:CARDB
MKKYLAALTLCLSAAVIAMPTEAQDRKQRPQMPPQPKTSLTAKAPDLVPAASRILKGGVSIRNAGSAASSASVATVVCKKIVGPGSCADSPALKTYTNPSYPNAVVVNVPALQPGHVHTHMLPFWNTLKWQPGTYRFTVTADAGKQINETNEGNNVGIALMKK